MAQPDHPEQAAPSRSSGRSPLQSFVLLVLAAAPAILALSTWQVPYVSTSLRYFSAPFVAAEILVIIAVLLSGTRITKAFGQLRPLTRLSALGLLAVAAATTFLIAPLPEMARPHFAISLIHMALALVLYAALCGEWYPQRRALLAAAMAGAALQALTSYGLALSIGTMRDFDWLHFGAGVTHVRQLGFCGLTLSGLAAGFYATASSSRARIGYGALLVLGLAWSDLSGGRASIGAALAGAGVVVLLSPRGCWLRLALAFSAAFLAAAALSVLALAATPAIPHQQWGLYLAWLKLIGEAGLDDFSSRRMDVWQQTLAAIRQAPLLGHGEGQFRSLIPAALGRLNHPHNSLLQFLYQWGAAGTACLAVLVVPTALSALRTVKADAPVILPAAGALAGLAAMSMLDGSLNYPFPIAMAIIALVTIASARPQSA